MKLIKNKCHEIFKLKISRESLMIPGVFIRGFSWVMQFPRTKLMMYN